MKIYGLFDAWEGCNKLLGAEEGCQWLIGGVMVVQEAKDGGKHRLVAATTCRGAANAG